jgi:uncharacterized membrane protein
MGEKDFLKSKIQQKLPYIILFLMIAIYTAVLSITSIDYYNRFYFSAFDLGIFDQGIWLLSKGKDPFVTVRGLHLFGDHIQFTIVFFVPLFWLWEDTRILLFAQSLVLSLGAIPLFLIARKKFKNKYIPLIFVLAYFLYPALHYLNLENFHPVVLSVPLLFFAFYFLEEKKYFYYFVFILLLLLTREELVLTIFAIGLYAFFFQNKKIGLITMGASLLWLFLIFNVIFPYYIPFSHPNIRRGGNVLERSLQVLSNPKEILALYSKENQKYIFELFSPLAFLPILHLQTLFLALPALAINIITSWPYTHSIQYHYTYAIIPFVFISSVYAIDSIYKLMKKRKFKFARFILYSILFIFLLSSILGNIFIGPDSTSIKNYRSIMERIINFNNFSEYEKIRYEAISLIPKNASVSATYLFVPHLSHREIIYMFPNPFKEAYWGAELGNFTPPTPTKDVDYILLDDTPNEFERSEIIEKLLMNETYSKIFEKDHIYILKKM